MTTRVEVIYKGRKGNIEKGKKAFYSQQRAIEQKRDVAEEKLFSGLLSDEDFSRIKKRYREQIESLKDEIYKLDQQLNLKLDEAQEVLALVRNIYKTYMNAPDELQRLYLGLFWERFEAKEKQIVKAEPARFIKALMEAKVVITNQDKTPPKHKPQLAGAGAYATSARGQKVIIENVWGGQRELNPYC